MHRSEECRRASMGLGFFGEFEATSHVAECGCLELAKYPVPRTHGPPFLPVTEPLMASLKLASGTA